MSDSINTKMIKQFSQQLSEISYLIRENEESRVTKTIRNNCEFNSHMVHINGKTYTGITKINDSYVCTLCNKIFNVEPESYKIFEHVSSVPIDSDPIVAAMEDCIKTIKSRDYKITKEKFRERVGRDPEHDDLERCNCDSSGKVGHFTCGWCEKCDLPRFVCGHVLINEHIPVNK